MYFNIFYRFSFDISRLSCYEGSYLAFFIIVFKNDLYYSSIFYCYCLISNFSWLFRTFLLLLLCWDESCLLLDVSCCFVSSCLLFVVELWAIPVAVWELPVFLLRFLSKSLSFIKYSAAPGISYLEWISIASF